MSANDTPISQRLANAIRIETQARRDPHPDWLRHWREVTQKFNECTGDSGHEFADEAAALADLIAATPAGTREGITAQLTLFEEYVWQEHADGVPEPFRNALDVIRIALWHI